MYLAAFLSHKRINYLIATFLSQERMKYHIVLQHSFTLFPAPYFAAFFHAIPWIRILQHSFHRGQTRLASHFEQWHGGSLLAMDIRTREG
jgi:hypothetical protein